MIEISHKQAQHLIREGQDRRLPDEQWAILQAHLESCPECRAYQQRLVNYERDLHRALRYRWSAVRGPRPGVAKRVMAFREHRKATRAALLRGSLYVLGGLLLVGLLVYHQLTRPEPVIVPTPAPAFGAAAVSTTTPTLNPLGIYNGLVALETRRDGNAEIYLMKTGPSGLPELTNLTQDPANDTWPAWSPDGQWIAFLSDRPDTPGAGSPARNEVYVVHIAGSRLTRLTADPEITWQGPLEWSYDGKQLALIGRRGGPNGDPYIYLVPLDGSGARSIAGTRGVQGRLRFSSTQPALAFANPLQPGGLRVVNTQTGWIGDVTQEDAQVFHSDFSAIARGAFDWSLGGRSLVYAASTPNGAVIRLSQDIEVGAHTDFSGSNASQVDTLAYPNEFQAISWEPHSLMVGSLVAGNGGCRTVRLSNGYNREQAARDFPGLCVTGEINHFSWSSDGTWLVLLGRAPADTQPAYYAVRMPDASARADTSRLNAQSPTFVKLAELNSADAARLGAADNASAAADGTAVEELMPRVRPAGQAVNVNPQPAPLLTPTPQPLTPAADPFRQVVYAARDGGDNGATGLFRAVPGGAQSAALTGTGAAATCPRLAPDGKSIAYLTSGVGEGQQVTAEVWRADSGGQNAASLARYSFARTNLLTSGGRLAFPIFGCPTWSPDGKRLALVINASPRASFLAILPADGQTPPVYRRISLTSTLSAPVWLLRNAQNPALGADQLLLVYPRYGDPARLVQVDLTGLDQPAPRSSPTAVHAGANPAATATAVGAATEPALNLPTPTPANPGAAVPGAAAPAEMAGLIGATEAPPAKVQVRLELTSWDDVQDLTLSPDGKRLAMLDLYIGNIIDVTRTRLPVAQLRVLALNSWEPDAAVGLTGYDPAVNGLGGLGWLSNSVVGLARVTSFIGPVKTTFQTLDLASSSTPLDLRTLATTEDLATRAVFGPGQDQDPDTGWVFYAAESGLYALPLNPSFPAPVAPIPLTRAPATDLDWK